MAVPFNSQRWSSHSPPQSPLGVDSPQLHMGVFAVLVTPCDYRGPMGLVGEASPVKRGRLHSPAILE